MYSPHPLRNYDVSPDGRRFLVLRQPGKLESQPAPTELHVALNWTEAIKQLAAAQGPR